MGRLKELAEIYLQRKIKSEREKFRNQNADYVFNQKKQIWYHMMDAIDGTETQTEETLKDKQEQKEEESL